MKKIIVFIMAAMMLFIQTVYAGDIPEAMLSDDNAQLFLGTIAEYFPEHEPPYINVIPVERIKGEVRPGIKMPYFNPEFMGNFEYNTETVYLFAYLNEDNPASVFEVTGQDTEKMKLIGVSGSMWERFERYLNDGEYEKAETDRRKRMDEERTLADRLNLKREDIVSVKAEVIRDEIVSYDVDADKFFGLIQGIMTVRNEGTKRDAVMNGIYFTITKNDGENIHFYISVNGEIDSSCSLMMSRLPFAEYKTDRWGVERLNELLPADGRAELPKENSYIPIAVLILFIIPVAIAARRKKKA